MAIQRIDAISIKEKDVSVVWTFVNATVCCQGGI